MRRYLTRADYYIVVVFVYHVLMALRAVYRSTKSDSFDEQPDLWTVLDELWVDFMLMALWLIPHIFIFLGLNPPKLSAERDRELGGSDDDDDFFSSWGVRQTWAVKYEVTLAALKRMRKPCQIESFEVAKKTQPAGAKPPFYMELR